MDPDFDRRYFDDDSIDLCKSKSPQSIRAGLTHTAPLMDLDAALLGMAELLEKDPRKRLGARGSADVMAHPWFIRGEAWRFSKVLICAVEPIGRGRPEGSGVMKVMWPLSLVSGGVEWDVMIADAAEPPFVPNQDINAASQSAIGSFNDENQYRKVGHRLLLPCPRAPSHANLYGVCVHR